MIRISRIAYAVLDTPDLERQIEHSTCVLGLTLVERDKTTAYLSTIVDHHTLVLRKGSEARCVALGFQIPPETDLSDYASHIEGHGIGTRRLTDSQPNIKDLLTFTDPKGTEIEVFAEHQPVSHRHAVQGVVPNKLGHVAHNVADLPASMKFYCDVMGFRVSDWMGDFFVFLRCGTDHHTINFIRSQKTKMHHIAFELRDWGHVKDACDTLALANVPLIWGPARHGIGHGISLYHRNPDGQIIEHFCETDRMDETTGSFEPRRLHLDCPQKPKVWSDPMQASNMWGIPPPEGFLD